MLRTVYPKNVVCPLEGSALVFHNSQLRCGQGHAFDVARDGYVNLLPVQQKKSKAPGDNKVMVVARTQFLEGGYYTAIVESLHRVLQHFSGQQNHLGCVLDAACGEGYYLRALAQRTCDAPIEWVGVDISKYAVAAAAKKSPQLTWLVASNRQLPLAAQSVDVVLSVFGFPCVPEFLRVLHNRGIVMTVEPGAQHLLELRTQLYETLAEKNPATPAFNGLVVRDEHVLNYQTPPLPNSALVNLLKMTPHYYRAPKAALDRVCALADISVTVDVKIKVWQKS